ncbi:unnamed protein product [Echinostoma caproni]|uniref:Protein kinase C n=1 Tax=Echinostoma caproni TaxID=27848 RepID=A0A183A6M3_9TREM|nr:unnamed protein product [Echinostoma caproni]
MADSNPIKVGQIRPISASSVRAGGLLYGRPLWTQQVLTTPVEVPHTFELHRSAKPTVCQHCRRLLHGLFRQGLQCKDTGSIRAGSLADHLSAGKLKKKLFLRGQTVGTINAAESSHTPFPTGRVDCRSAGRLRRQLTEEETEERLETKNAYMQRVDFVNQKEFPRDSARRKASFRSSQHKRNMASGFDVHSSRVMAKSDEKPCSIESTDGAIEAPALERERSIERGMPKMRPGTSKTGPRNIPLMRVIQSVRHTKRPGAELIIRESWMVHRTNKDPMLRRHFWRIGAKAITMFYHERTNRYYKEIPLSSIICLEPSGTNYFPWKEEGSTVHREQSTNADPNSNSLPTLDDPAQGDRYNNTRPSKPNHVFEMRCVDGTVYFVGQLAYGESMDTEVSGAFNSKSRRKSHFPTLPSAQSYARKASAPMYGLIHLVELLPQVTTPSQLLDPKNSMNWFNRPTSNCVEEIDGTEGVYRAAILPPPPGTGLDMAKHLETALRQSLLPLTSKTSSQTTRSSNASSKPLNNMDPASSPVCDLIPVNITEGAGIPSSSKLDSNTTGIEPELGDQDNFNSPSMNQLELAAEDEEGTGSSALYFLSTVFWVVSRERAKDMHVSIIHNSMVLFPGKFCADEATG